MSKLKSATVYLRTWLDRCRQAQDAAPAVRAALERLEWEDAALDGVPADGTNLSTASVDDHLDSLHGRLTSCLPMLPAILATAVTMINSLTTCSTSPQ